jgi:DNA polymerase elongation subunit (family B)
LKKNVKEGIKRVLQLIRTRGFNVISMTTDGEFACLKEWTHSKGVYMKLLELVLMSLRLRTKLEL